MALHQFLRLLQWLRRVLLQDAALLYSDYPNCPLFRFPPFSTLVFRTFAANSKAAITHAEEAARHAFQNIPHHLVQSLRGIITTAQLEQDKAREEHSQSLAEVREQCSQVKGLVEMLVTSKGSRRRKGKSRRSSFSIST